MVTKRKLKKIRKSLESVADMMSPNAQNVQSILSWIIPDIDADELKKSLIAYYKYLESDDSRWIPMFDPLPTLFAKYTFLTTHMKLTIKIGRSWWGYIQRYVGNPEFILQKVGEKNPKVASMLDTELGAKFIEYYTGRLYTFFDLYFHKFPRWHNECGGLIQYKLVNKTANVWGWQCRRCGAVISTDDIDTMSYQKRLYPEMKRKDNK